MKLPSDVDAAELIKVSKTEGKDRTAEAFRDAETANLRVWIKLNGGQNVDFFKEMAELACLSGALQPERLAPTDKRQHEKSL